MKQNTAVNKNKSQILIVDDELSVHKLLTTYLKKQGYLVENCMDSTQVLQKVKTYPPDLILLDLMMPDLDGITLTRRLRNLEFDSYLPIIVLTAKKGIKDMVAALEAGADDYITKPFEFEELVARIKNMLRLKKLQDRLMHKTVELDEANQQISRLNHVLTETNRKLQKKLYDFHSIFELSYRVMGQLESKELIRQALINILGIVPTKSVILLLTNKDDDDLYEVVDYKGVNDQLISDFRIYRHDKLIHYLELIKKAFQINDVSGEFQDVINILKSKKIEVVSPLLRNENIVGLLCLGPNIKEEVYSEDSLETVSILTNMLAVALHNAQMYEHIKELSYTDGMTGLHNYRFFRLRLKEELARARREGGNVSLLIIDVDHFKNYNDTLGHPAGDKVLRKVSDILKKSVRDNDIVARYGGEEFAIILPGASKEGAIALADRIRLKVEQTKFYQEEIQPGGKLTISVGTATFPKDSVSEEELIFFADQALYYAKKTGRNRVAEATEIMEDE